jgi:hypothetical protein
MGRVVSVTVQLSSDEEYEGGDLQLGAALASRVRGAATLFPSL